MKDTFIPANNSRTKQWFVINAENKTLGRLATEISKFLLGKTKVTYTPFLDTGAHVIILNGEKIVLSANKERQKIYRTHSGRPGGMRVETFSKLQQSLPKKIILNAIKGMLPKKVFGREIYKNLNVYKGNQHPHRAQTPKLLHL